jgi:acyl transferase domain-containing protein/acyl-CoA synthetase (AMP-forming)/AMP-acid ligase II/acyl carrier protein
VSSSLASSGPKAGTFVDLLGLRAQETPKAPAVTFLADGETDEQRLTYALLDRHARRIAVRLRSCGIVPGERVLLIYPPGLDYVTAFFGCLYAGAIAVPAYPPVLNRPSSQVTTFIENATPAAAFTISAIVQLRDSLVDQEPAIGTIPWLATDEIEEGLESDWRRPDITPETIAFLQYSSGSTSTPKGVVLTHSTLLTNTAAMCDRADLGPQTRTVSWLPPYHDAGLIGKVLTPLVGGFPTVLMSPIAFLQRPARWLEAIERHRATCSAAPNFAYDLCVRKTTPEQRAALDLSSWNRAMNTGEPVRAETLRRFASAFASAGFRYEAFYPCYGLAESTVMVAGPDPAERPRVARLDRDALQAGRIAPARDGRQVHELVACGHELPAHRVVIADPDTRQTLGERQIGEIWVHGPSVARGYWGKPQATEEGFNARLADGDPTPFMRTGDLGFLDGGEIHVTGRAKDVVIVRGRNHYPQDIECTVEQAHGALRPGCGAAFAVEESEEERLIVVNEVDPQRLEDTDAVLSAVTDAVLRQHGIQPQTVMLIARGALPKTSSGKQRRRATRQRFLDGELSVVAQWHAPRPGTATPSPETATPRPSAATPSPAIATPRPSAATPSPAIATPRPDTATPSAAAPGTSAFGPQRTAIEAWLTDRIAYASGLDAAHVGAEQPFAAFGLDSVRATALVGELSTWLGHEVAVTAPWDYPTIARLARYVSGEEACPADGEGRSPRGRVKPISSAPGEPIAVVGVGCRFPGAPDLPAFRELLRRGADASGTVPPDRWDAEALYDPEPATPGRIVSRRGAFIDGVDLFDAGFFGIAPAEAASVDPQQRLLMEVAWEALEHAGQAPAELAGSATGVFVGIGTADYFQLQVAAGALSAYSATGTAHSVASNRLSYTLDLRGPSVAVDTACSSSLVALDLACRSLRSSETDLALAGGVSLMLAPHLSIALSQANMLSPDGRCKTFDAAADGYGRGEGCGVVVLKRLADALRDGSRILTVIRGTAVSQDGQTSGLSAPNGPAQQAVIRRALADAGASPSEVGYVEAHGTGTALGDPIEVAALAAVFGDRDATAREMLIGSVKSNLGHLEAAAGIAGVVKVVLGLAHGELYPQASFRRLNPRIQLSGARLRVSTELTQWRPEQDRPRLAGVSSFGFGGTIAHAVLEEPPEPLPRHNRRERPLHAATLSARSDQALRELARRSALGFAEHAEPSLPDVAYTLNTGRARLPRRLAVCASSMSELCDELERFASGERASAIAGPRPPIAFLYTGQGAQHPHMTRALYETSPTFRGALGECAEILDRYVDEPLIALLFDGESPERIHQTAHAQPALVAVEYALTRLWASWGIVPDVVLGHSVGELTAALVSGALTLEDTLALAVERGRLMQELPPGGAMAAILAAPEVVQDELAGYGEEVSLAAINGPDAVTVSGAAETVQALVERFDKRGIRATPLRVSHAFHSPLIEPALSSLERAAARCRVGAPTIPIVECVTGELVDGPALDAGFWRRQARSPVLFGRAVSTVDAVLEDMQVGPLRVFLEVGPRPVLLGLARRALGPGERAWLASLRADAGDWAPLLDALTRLHLLGAPVDWRGFDRDYRREIVTLPAYPFERTRHWIGETDGIDTIAAATFSEHGQAPPALPKDAAAPPLREDLLGAERAQRKSLLETYLHAELARVLGLPPAMLDVSQPLREVGLDSIMMLEVRRRVERTLRVQLPIVGIAEGATVSDLADGLTDMLDTADGVHAADDLALR